MSKTPDHGKVPSTVCKRYILTRHTPVMAGLSATLASGIRSVFCYSLVPNIETWDSTGFHNAKSAIPDWFVPHLKAITSHPATAASDRVMIGLGYDSYHLPHEQTKHVFKVVRENGVGLITSHWRRNNIAGTSANDIRIHENATNQAMPKE
jgi:hypothetical protein